ncbi:hypothetical protein L211DRAFT_579076 [Terfezia boudieri ATCC MYA-4762]|uniref:Uncharacterized protein n=1 Tax=Terfezia boudieri ATCC MYA-4762 TaxID=1051890 RepID=A0A3N4LBH0_9PEZI|nr:hypothetical protein L211DRAFT_579076 [Terfezia boudieri ATCC MYA-4762]
MHSQPENLLDSLRTDYFLYEKYILRWVNEDETIQSGSDLLARTDCGRFSSLKGVIVLLQVCLGSLLLFFRVVYWHYIEDYIHMMWE